MTDDPLIDLGREVLGELEPGIGREWLVTNGLGGYASGTAIGVPTRAYHGLLIAALNPPVDRTVLVSGFEEIVRAAQAAASLHAIEHPGGGFGGGGFEHLVRLRLEGMLPVWTYEVAPGTTIERRVWMEDGASTTYVRYELTRGTEVSLTVSPLATARDHQTVAKPPGVPEVSPLTEGLAVRFGTGPQVAVRTVAPVEVEINGGWAGPVALREQAIRGEGEAADAWRVGRLHVALNADGPVTFVLSIEPAPDLDGEAALARARARQVSLVDRAGAVHASPVVRQLVVAADQFLVERWIPRGHQQPPDRGRTIIAGYHWFNDWGRDTMIAVGGLTLATGRAPEGATILRSFARFVRDGLLPNNFPDHAGEPVGYHTVDASLWYPVAIEQHRAATGDESLVDDLLDAVRGIVDAHVAGTHYGIGMDPTDGLLRGGEPGWQLTWMDAKLDDQVFTPRHGKPVEIQALWVNSLRILAAWLRYRGSVADAAPYEALADRAVRSFVTRFWRPDLGFLADVVDGPDGDETKLRPNQLLALSLPHPLVEQPVARQILGAVERALLTPGGLRSLAPADPSFRPRFHGDRAFRDAGYHQGTVWSWLIGPYVDAVLRFGDRRQAVEALRPFAGHLSEAGLGTVSENFEPTPPFEPRGCIAQAWGVAEVLRTWRAVTGE